MLHKGVGYSRRSFECLAKLALRKIGFASADPLELTHLRHLLDVGLIEWRGSRLAADVGWPAALTFSCRRCRPIIGCLVDVSEDRLALKRHPPPTLVDGDFGFRWLLAWIGRCWHLARQAPAVTRHQDALGSLSDESG